ncbi:hypothetical protein GCM10028801_36720 [Nocardioides maradonensis]
MWVDLEGIHFDAPFEGSADVYFGERRGWSFTATGQRNVGWPRKLVPFLDGWSDVRIQAGEQQLYAGRVAFTASDREVALVNSRGIAIVVDKWGLIQQPFETRGEGVVDAITEGAERMLEVMRRDCGIEGWISFGTLLGAARSGKAIGHDSDIDLCYVSEQETPAAMTVELWGIARALRAAGMKVVEKSGSFITVMVPTPDGASTGIDVYTTFFIDGNFYETATVRTPLPREAVLPLTEIEFEGRMMPAPADPARLMEVSYGPSWRIPDPSFQHQPSADIHDRFDEWFGSLFRQRRDWRGFNLDQAKADVPASDFAHWVGDQLEPGTRVVDIGSGALADLRLLAERGHPAVGMDYAHPPLRLRRLPEHARIEWVNLLDARDVLARGAIAARYDGPQVVYARQVLETLDTAATENFWTLTGLVLRRGGRLFVESETWPKGKAGQVHLTRGGGRIRPLSPRAVADAARRAGGRVVSQHGVADGVRALTGKTPATWRMVIDFPARAPERSENK